MLPAMVWKNYDSNMTINGIVRSGAKYGDSDANDQKFINMYLDGMKKGAGKE